MREKARKLDVENVELLRNDREKSKMLTETLIMLRTAKDKTDNLQRRHDDLISENAVLSKRAAVPFDELTPRYSKFSETFSELLIEKPLTLTK